MRNLRQEIQEATINRWVTYGCNGSALLCTGIGKTRTFSLALTYIFENHWEDIKDMDIPVLFVTSGTILRDKDTPKDLRKWGVPEEIISKIEFQCYQTTYKWTGRTIGLLLADEVDFSLTPKYAQLYHSNTILFKLLMTGTLTPYKEGMLSALAHMLIKCPIDYAMQNGILNKVEVRIHQIPMDTTHSIQWNKNITCTEGQAYDAVQNKVWKLAAELDYYAQNADYANSASIEKQIEWWTSNKRNPLARINLLYKSYASIEYSKWLIDYIKSTKPGSKIMTFSQLTEVTDAITANGYHGKKPDETLIDRFNSGEITDIGVVKKVNRGVNCIGLNHAIAQGITTSYTDFMQGPLGRLVRLPADQTAYIHLLLPYFYNSQKGENAPTQVHKWWGAIQHKVPFLPVKYVDPVALKLGPYAT